MKAVLIGADGVVVNVSVWDAGSKPPEGGILELVADDVFVGPGCKKAEDGTFYDPTPPAAPQVGG